MPAKLVDFRCVVKRKSYQTLRLPLPLLSMLIVYLTLGSNGKKFGPPAGSSSGM